MVEGGSSIHTAFLAEGLADEIRLAVAPIFVGDHRAPRFLNDGTFPADRMVLGGMTRAGDAAVLQYFPDPDRYWLRVCIEESRKCPPSDTAFPVGAVIVDAEGQEIARGYSRAVSGNHGHARVHNGFSRRASPGSSTRCGNRRRLSSVRAPPH
jgi:hypothetical protein